MQVESDHIQNMDQEQEADAENSRTESSEESNLGNPVKMEKVNSSDADGLEMWDSSSNTYTKVDDDTSVEFSGETDSEQEEALHVVGDISTQESVKTEIQSTAEMCELPVENELIRSVTTPTLQQSEPEEEERGEQESEPMDEDSDSDEFEMFSCERCDKYFVSQESLDSHKNDCE